MPPGHVQAHRLDRGPLGAHLDAERIGEALVGRLLAAVIGLDAVARELERGECLRLAGFLRRIDLGGTHPQAGLGQIDAVELGGQFEQRAVAARHDLGDDAAHGRLHVLRGLALDAEERAKALGKIGAAAVQSQRHEIVLPGLSPDDRSMVDAPIHVNPVAPPDIVP